MLPEEDYYAALDEEDRLQMRYEQRHYRQCDQCNLLLNIEENSPLWLARIFHGKRFDPEVNFFFCDTICFTTFLDQIEEDSLIVKKDKQSCWVNIHCDHCDKNIIHCFMYWVSHCVDKGYAPDMAHSTFFCSLFCVKSFYEESCQ
jgi:hypothetical protein